MKSAPLRLGFLLIFAFLLYCQVSIAARSNGCDGAGNCYVRAGATGSGTGADWRNAYTGFGTGTGQVNPSAMTRGVAYYVAGGNYSIGSVIVFDTPDSGTSPITLQAPTVASHGTNTGWSNSYVGQAGLPPIYVESDYWIFNGSYRGSGTGLPATDWRTGYGFKVNNNNGSNAPVGGACFWLGPATYPAANNVTIEYVECAGSGDTTGTYTDPGIWASQTQNTLIEYNYVHDTGSASFITDSSGNMTVAYNWWMNDQSTPAHHGEGMALRGNGNYTIAFNYLENEEGTGYIGTPCPGSTSCFTGGATWLIYGNVFFANPSEWHGNTSPQNGLSYAYFQYFGDSTYTANWAEIAFWNNTFYQIAEGMASTDCDAINGGYTSVTNFYFQNNLVVNCTASALGPPTSGSVTRDHNSYFSVTTVSDTGTGVQNVPGVIPFNGPSTDDLTLDQDTAAWTPLGSPYNVDLLGNTRTSSRGLLQFLAPPTGLAAIVH